MCELPAVFMWPVFRLYAYMYMEEIPWNDMRKVEITRIDSVRILKNNDRKYILLRSSTLIFKSKKSVQFL